MVLSQSPRKKLVVSAIFACLVLLLPALPWLAQADAWWGKGYREPQWVLRNGGSIIHYSVTGKGDPKNYKARLYLNNKVIETEDSGKGMFDDAKNNTYTVIISRSGKKKMSTTVKARPGEEIWLNFDLNKKTVVTRSASSQRAKVRPQPATLKNMYSRKTMLQSN
jgi:hypothetical protein